jgi:hypothetical protein
MSSPEQETLTQDVVFDLLSNPRRRYVLFHLSQVDEPIQLRDLADEVSSWENEVPVNKLTNQQRKRVYVSLYQTHIHSHQDAGVDDYDSDSGYVRLAERSDELGSYISGDDDQLPWQLYYIALAAVSAGLYFLVAFEVAPFAAPSTFAVGVAIIGAFAVLALAHYISYRRSSWDPSDLIAGEQ